MQKYGLSSTASSPPQISESDFQALEQLVVCLYSSTTNTCEINLARRILFAKGRRTVENWLGLASNRVGISSGKANLPEASNVCRVPITVNAGARNIISVKRTKLYVEKYALVWETVPIGNEC